MSSSIWASSFSFRRGERLRHGTEIHLQLVDVGHAGNGGGEALVAQHPLQRR